MIGWAATALAVAGIVLPLLPTTPFALVAAWAFARSSPRLAAALEAHPRLGPLLRDWRERGAVPRRAKALACAGLTTSWLILLLTGASPLVLGLAGAVMVAVGLYLATRPD